MHRRVATGRPTGAAREKLCVRHRADADAADRGGGAGDLRVAPETKIVVARDEQLVVDRTVRLMARGTTFAQRGMYEHARPGLLAVTLGARLIPAAERETSRRFENVRSVRVVALNAIHLTFHNGMVMRQAKLSVNFLMTIETGHRITTGIHDEPPPTATHANVFASRTMAGFAAGASLHIEVRHTNSCVGTRRESTVDVGVAIEANLVADIFGALNFGCLVCFNLTGPTGGNQRDGQNQSGSYRPVKPFVRHQREIRPISFGVRGLPWDPRAVNESTERRNDRAVSERRLIA